MSIIQMTLIQTKLDLMSLVWKILEPNVMLDLIRLYVMLDLICYLDTFSLKFWNFLILYVGLLV